jgi:hypothetical protein
MSALEKKGMMDRDEKMNTTTEKNDVEEQHQLKNGHLDEAPIECKPRGCISRGGLY